MESLFCEETLIENVKDIRPVAMTIDVPPMVDVNLVKDQRVLENMLTKSMIELHCLFVSTPTPCRFLFHFLVNFHHYGEVLTSISEKQNVFTPF